MRILTLSNLYPPDFIGGYEIVCQQMVDALRDRGHEVCVLTSAPRSPVPTPPHVERSLQLADVYDLPVCHANHVRALAEVRSRFINSFNVYRLLTLLESFRPEVIYLHNLEGIGGLGLLSCLQHLRVPWVWQLGDRVLRTLCSSAYLKQPNRVGDESIPVLVQEVNHQLRGHYIVCSQRLLVEIQTCGLRLNGPCEVLPNWITGDRPPPRNAYLRDGQLRVVTAGQLVHQKGTDILIQACARLREMGYRNFIVDVYGKIDDCRWQCLIDKLGLRDCITLRGCCPHADLQTRFRNYDVFAFPTLRREPFGVAPLEAAAQGCVPLLSRFCGIAEWLVDGVHCLKTERTADAFAAVLARILDGQIDLAPIGRRVAAVTRRDFHIDVISPKVERVLRWAANQSRAGGGTWAEAYHLAILADRTAQVLVNEFLAA